MMSAIYLSNKPKTCEQTVKKQAFKIKIKEK